MAYLTADRPNLTVRGDAPVARVLFDGDRARGVELVDGAGRGGRGGGARRRRGGRPQLLLRSGIGPADELRAAGVDVRLDLPGVGRGWSDHPAVFLPFADADPPAHPHAPSGQAALNLDCGRRPGRRRRGAAVRPPVRPRRRPAPDVRAAGTRTAADDRDHLGRPDAAPVIPYGYLRTEHDRRRLRHAIRTAAELLRAGLGARTAPAGDVLGNDRALDGWIAAHLTTAVHLCGSAAMGRVVDEQLRVLGVARPAGRRHLGAPGRAPPRHRRPPPSRSARRPPRHRRATAT